MLDSHRDRIMTLHREVIGGCMEWKESRWSKGKKRFPKFLSSEAENENDFP